MSYVTNADGWAVESRGWEYACGDWTIVRSVNRDGKTEFHVFRDVHIQEIAASLADAKAFVDKAGAR